MCDVKSKVDEEKDVEAENATRENNRGMDYLWH